MAHPIRPAIDRAGLAPAWRALAVRVGRAEFAAACRHPFLLLTSRVVRPTPPRGTRDATGEVEAPPTDACLADRVLAIRKTHHLFPSMITVGRTPNNDLLLPDVTISRLHAYFRLDGDVTWLFDAGSLNGTWAGAHRLPPKGAPARVQPGAHLRFGTVELRLCGAAEVWEMVRNPPDVSDP